MRTFSCIFYFIPEINFHRFLHRFYSVFACNAEMIAKISTTGDQSIDRSFVLRRPRILRSSHLNDLRTPAWHSPSLSPAAFRVARTGLCPLSYSSGRSRWVEQGRRLPKLWTSAAWRTISRLHNAESTTDFPSEHSWRIASPAIIRFATRKQRLTGSRPLNPFRIQIRSIFSVDYEERRASSAAVGDLLITD